MARRGVDLGWLDQMLDRVERRLGKPVDQTDGPALAQIQAAVRKRAMA